MSLRGWPSARRVELLGNCFWREGFEAAFGPDRMGEKGGYFNKLQVENLVDADQAKEGFRTMLVSGYFDFAILEPNGICKAVNS